MKTRLLEAAWFGASAALALMFGYVTGCTSRPETTGSW